MRRAWRAWVALLSRTERGEALAVFRMAVGVILVGWLGSMVTSGLVGVLWVDARHGGYRALGQGNWLLSALGGPTPAVVWPLCVATLACGCMVAAGLGGRVAALAALQGFRALHTIDREAVGGDDALLTNALWLLVLAQSTATLSLDCRLRTGKWCNNKEIPSWPRQMAIVQLVVVYAYSGLNKLSAVWTPAGGYAALYWVLQDPTWQRFDMTWAAWVYPLTQAATAITWHFETSAPLLLAVYWFRETRGRPGRVRAAFNRWDLRVPFTVVGVALHAGVLALFSVGAFSWITLSFYVCLWHPDELRRAAGALAARAARARGRAYSSGGPDARAT